MRVTFEVEGVTLLNRSFSRVGQRLSDLRPVWDNLQPEFWDIEKEQFGSQGAKGASGQWPSLTREYAKRKAERWGVKPILRASDRLYESLTGQTGDTVLFKEPQEFGIGTSVPYGPFHQRGGGKLPKRPVIDFSETTKRRLIKSIQRDLLAEMKKDPAIRLDIT